MNGLNVLFECPTCGYRGEICLGCTEIIKIKNVEVALHVTQCLSCNALVAFEAVECDDTFTSIVNRYRITNDTLGVTREIVDFVTSLPEDIFQDEENIKEKVIKYVSERHGDTYVEENYVSIVTILEVITSAIIIERLKAQGRITNVDLSTVKEENIKLLSVTCY